MLAGTKQQPTLAHLHGMLFFGWTLFFLLQHRWVTSGKTAKHREWDSLELRSRRSCFAFRHLDDDSQSARQHRAWRCPSSQGIFVVCRLRESFLCDTDRQSRLPIRHNRELHKRIMLVATHLDAAPDPRSRDGLFLFLAPPGAVDRRAVEFTVPPGLVSDLLIVVAMVYDKKTRGQHSSKLIGLPAAHWSRCKWLRIR